ncbi:MAG: hypothetical protein HOP02_13435 [Methylococcaceae bacterium]|nr:hypothetical protein [Methylococcaceae bacterium]
MKHDDEKLKCFVIMPFSEEFHPIWEAIKDVGIKDCHITVARADSHTKQPLLTENVFSHIDDCDLVVIDITGLNLNVIFEFGYAVNKKKYIIAISQEEAKSLPADLRNYLYLPYNKDQLEEFKIDLRNRYREELKKIEDDRHRKYLENQILIVKDTFQVECISNRNKAELEKVFSKANREIKIIQTNMATVVKKYVEPIQEALKLTQDLEVNFLALDPESYFAAVRANQLGKDVSEFRNDLRNALFSLYDAFKNEERVEIRIYDDFPTQICFIIDGVIYNCVVSKYQPSRNNCVFKLSDTYPSLHTSFMLHFTSVWRDNNTTRKYTPLTIRNLPTNE